MFNQEPCLGVNTKTKRPGAVDRNGLTFFDV